MLHLTLFFFSKTVTHLGCISLGILENVHRNYVKIYKAAALLKYSLYTACMYMYICVYTYMYTPPLSKLNFVRKLCGSVHHSIIYKENPPRCNSVSKLYFIFMWSSTCFGRHTTHHQEPKTALTASGFAYVEGCWMCSCWTLSASSNYASNNPPRTQNQKLLVQF